jgi:uncharacterized membrane protein
MRYSYLVCQNKTEIKAKSGTRRNFAVETGENSFVGAETVIFIIKIAMKSSQPHAIRQTSIILHRISCAVLILLALSLAVVGQQAM